MNIFKQSYKVVRKNSDEIYGGFGFRHLSDATQYYVHPSNESYRGTTTLCQPIGEAVVLFSLMLKSISSGKGFGDYYFNEERDEFYLEFEVPEDYRNNEVTGPSICSYRASCIGNEIRMGAFDCYGRWLSGSMKQLNHRYKLLPAFMVLLARELETNSDYNTLFDNFLEKPAADVFVNVHEDFYQNHKAEDYELEYTNLPSIDKEAYKSYSEVAGIIWANKELANDLEVEDILRFPEDAFSEEQKMLIPCLAEEFVLPVDLYSVSSAVCAGDMLAVLLHGPAGTGKTMSCKLMAQAIGLPLVATVNCTENLDEFVLGKYIPEGDRIIFKESGVTEAIRYGGAVVFEEINFARPQYLAFLNSLLDDNGFVRLDNGEIVKRHRNFRFFATMNIGYFGTKELNQALYNRFNGIVEIAALPDESISRMLVARIPACKSVVDKILSVYHKLKKKIEAEELDVVISPRNLENWAKMARYEGYIRAAEKTIIPVAKCDRALEEAIRGIIRIYKWH